VVQTEPCEHHTQPPPRYSEASLVRHLVFVINIKGVVEYCIL